jgi:hypothetical protein
VSIVGRLSLLSSLYDRDRDSHFVELPSLSSSSFPRWGLGGDIFLFHSISDKKAFSRGTTTTQFSCVRFTSRKEVNACCFIFKFWNVLFIERKIRRFEAR